MQQGDLVFCHNSNLIGRAIRWGEWLRFRKGAYYNHVATLDIPVPNSNGDWFILQANQNGVTCYGYLSDLSKNGSSYEVVPAPAGVNTAKQIEFLYSQIGRHYGWLTIASIVTTLILPQFINVMLPNTWICSAIAAEACRAGGWIHSWPDIYQVAPAQLFEVVTGERDPHEA